MKTLIVTLALLVSLWLIVGALPARALGTSVPGGGVVVGMVFDNGQLFYAIEWPNGSITFGGPF